MESLCLHCDSPIPIQKLDSTMLDTLASVSCPNCGVEPVNCVNSIRIGNPEEAAATIAPFTIIRPLGRGGFGTVWLALDTQLKSCCVQMIGADVSAMLICVGAGEVSRICGAGRESQPR